MADGNGDRHSEFPPPRTKYPTLPELSEQPSKDEMLVAITNIALRYNEVERHQDERLDVIEAKLMLVHSEVKGIREDYRTLAADVHEIKDAVRLLASTMSSFSQTVARIELDLAVVRKLLQAQ